MFVAGLNALRGPHSAAAGAQGGDGPQSPGSSDGADATGDRRARARARRAPCVAARTVRCAAAHAARGVVQPREVGPDERLARRALVVADPEEGAAAVEEARPRLAATAHICGCACGTCVLVCGRGQRCAAGTLRTSHSSTGVLAGCAPLEWPVRVGACGVFMFGCQLRATAERVDGRPSEGDGGKGPPGRRPRIKLAAEAQGAHARAGGLRID